MPYKDPEKNREYQRNWQRKRRNKQKEYDRRVRIRVLEKLGGKCVYCGCDNFNALEINHINGCGRREKRERWKSGSKAYYLAILNGSRKTDDLELTCRVCNAYHYLTEIKGINGDWLIQWLGTIEGIPSKS